LASSPESSPDEISFEFSAAQGKEDSPHAPGRLPQVNLGDQPFSGDKPFNVDRSAGGQAPLSSETAMPPEAVTDFASPFFAPEAAEKPLKGKPQADAPPAGKIEISFEDLFAGGAILQGRTPASEQSLPAKETPGLEISLPSPEPHGEDDSAAFFAVDDVLRQEIESSFGSSTLETAAPEGLSQVFDDTPPQAESAGPPAETELPYVDVHEILQQDGAESGSRVVDEPAASTATPREDFPEWPEGALQQALQRGPSSNGANNGSETDHGRLANPPADLKLVKSATPAPFPPPQPERPPRPAELAAAKPRPSAAPERRKDGWNGAARREDERERLLIAGLRHYKNQRFKEAIAEFENAIRIYPDFKEAYSILGNAYFRNRMYDQAARAYSRVKEMDPYDTTAYENMGVIHANRGEYMEAMKEWQRVLEIDPGRDDIRKKIERASRLITRKVVA
jgi:TolA-binding protein